MRTKDKGKQQALFDAAVDLVNEIGFDASSVSKIAKRAGISPATLYIYHENKEKLLISSYITIKQNLGRAALKNFDASRPIRQILETVWFNMFDYIKAHPRYFEYTEQFAHSPYQEKVNKEEIESFFMPLIDVIQKGIDANIIKNVDFDILTAFMLFPIVTLSNNRICHSFKPTQQNIETAFSLAWDAVRI